MRALQHQLGLKLPTAVQVVGVDPAGPARSAGIEPGDLVVEADSKPIGSMDDLYRVLSARPPNTPVQVRVVRNLRSVDLTVLVKEDNLPEGAAGGAGLQRLPAPEHFRPVGTEEWSRW